MNDLVIRTAHSEDLDSLVDLLGFLFGIEADFVIDPERQKRGLTLLLGQVGTVVLVAESAGKVIGMCSGQQTISTAEGGTALLVEDVVVAEKWQGMGVGHRLMKGLEQWARNEGIERLQLLADRNNRPALNFYQKNDWQSTELICLRRRLVPGS